jgi:hypothetical protein
MYYLDYTDGSILDTHALTIRAKDAGLKASEYVIRYNLSVYATCAEAESERLAYLYADVEPSEGHVCYSL